MPPPPADPEAISSLTRAADAAFKAGDVDVARRLYEEAARLGSADGHVGVGTILGNAGDFADALAHFEAALAIDSRHAAAHYNSGIALERQQRLAEALGSFERALEIQPKNLAALVSCGETLRRMGDVEAATLRFQRALEIDPLNKLALNNLATTLLDSGDLDAAHAVLERLAAAHPGFAKAAFNLGIIALHRKDFVAGWRGTERRFEVLAGMPAPIPGVPALDPTRAGGKRVAVQREQGVGDQLLFSTLLPELEACGARAVVEVDARLHDSYARSFPGTRFVVPEGAADAFADCDAQVAMGTLPQLFRPSLASFARQPASILEPDRERVAQASSTLRGARNVAIAWRSFQRGSRRHVEGRKSIPLACFAALALPGVRLLDLQYGDVAAERAAFDLLHPGIRTEIPGLNPFDDLEGVMAALRACDLVVTGSNVTAHLAGAIGKRTWLVYLGANPVFYYWVPGPEGRSLWYPSVEIMTNSAWKTWDQAFEAVAARWKAEYAG